MGKPKTVKVELDGTMIAMLKALLNQAERTQEAMKRSERVQSNTTTLPRQLPLDPQIEHTEGGDPS